MIHDIVHAMRDETIRFMMFDAYLIDIPSLSSSVSLFF